MEDGDRIKSVMHVGFGCMVLRRWNLNSKAGDLSGGLVNRKNHRTAVRRWEEGGSKRV